MLFHANRRQGVSFSVHMFTNQETFPSAGTITISQDINNDSKDKHISFFHFLFRFVFNIRDDNTQIKFKQRSPCIAIVNVNT